MSLRDDLQEIVAASLRATDGRSAVSGSVLLEGNRLRIHAAEFDLDRFTNIRLIAAGKAAASMAEGLMGVLGDRIKSGIVVTKDGHAPKPRPEGVTLWEAGHPLPDARSLAAAAETLRFARSTAADDLVICLLSGGASALLAAPPANVSLGDLQEVTKGLLRSGAPIGEVNTVRKHLSRISGGRLARAIAPGCCLTLAISDVVGAAPDVIASGPTVPDPSTYEDALALLNRREIDIPASVLRHLQQGAAGEIPESPKKGELDSSMPFIIADNHDALSGASARAEELGYRTESVSENLEGEAREIAVDVANRALEARRSDGAPIALLWGGETTVTVRGTGKGGRNQELALAAAIALDGDDGIVVGAIATDGTDGPTDAAGGIIDGSTAGRGRSLGKEPSDHLSRNDSYTFLKYTGDLLITGPTGTNVNDVIIALIAPADSPR